MFLVCFKNLARQRVFLFSCLLFFAVFSSVPAFENVSRTWVYRTPRGKEYRSEGLLQEVSGEYAVILVNGEPKNVKISGLSSSDKMYIEEFQRSQEETNVPEIGLQDETSKTKEEDIDSSSSGSSSDLNRNELDSRSETEAALPPSSPDTDSTRHRSHNSGKDDLSHSSRNYSRTKSYNPSWWGAVCENINAFWMCIKELCEAVQQDAEHLDDLHLNRDLDPDLCKCYIAGAVLILLLIWIPFYRSIRRRRFIKDTPISKTTGVFIGHVQLSGTAESVVPLTAYLSKTPSVWYAWSIEEEWRRERVEVTYNEKGEKEEKKVVETGWITVAGSGASQIFYLKDDHGSIRINPDKAEIVNVCTFIHTCGPYDPIYYGLGPSSSIADTTWTRRFTEYSIPLHHPIFVSGRSRVRDDAVAAEIAYHPDAKLFLISTNPKESIEAGKSSAAVLSAIVFMVGFGIGGAYFYQNLAFGLICTTAALGFLFLTWCWIVHLSSVELKNRALQAKSNVDVELKRRHDLICPLVETIKGLRNYEQDFLTKLTELRSQIALTGVDKIGKDVSLAPTKNIVAGIFEKYPNLKSEALFLNLQKNLSETEERIALARQYYNDTVEYVNNRRDTFPNGIIARLSGLRKMDYLSAEEFERDNAEVKFQ